MTDDLFEAVAPRASEAQEVVALEYVPQAGLDVQSLMAAAVAQGDASGVEILERLMDLRDREVSRQAEQAMAEALWQFKQRVPPIPRDKRGTGFQGRDGAMQYVWYAPLDTIQRIVDPLLSELGLWYSWSSEASERSVTTTCTLSHVSGATRTASMVLPVTGPPKSSATQAHAGTRSFAKRLTLSDVLGLSTTDDLDGADGDAGAPISDDQLRELRALVQRKLGTDIDRFLAWAGVESLDQMPGAKYDEAVRFLNAKADR